MNLCCSWISIFLHGSSVHLKQDYVGESLFKTSTASLPGLWLLGRISALCKLLCMKLFPLRHPSLSYVLWRLHHSWQIFPLKCSCWRASFPLKTQTLNLWWKYLLTVFQDTLYNYEIYHLCSHQGTQTEFFHHYSFCDIEESMEPQQLISRTAWLLVFRFTFGFTIMLWDIAPGMKMPSARCSYPTGDPTENSSSFSRTRR